MKATRQNDLSADEAPNAVADDKPSHHEIALAAYAIWERRGRPDDDGVGDWLEAETRLLQARRTIPYEL